MILFRYGFTSCTSNKDATEDKDSEHSEQSDSCGPPTKKACIFGPHGYKSFNGYGMIMKSGREFSLSKASLRIFL